MVLHMPLIQPDDYGNLAVLAARYMIYLQAAFIPTTTVMA